MEGNKNAPRMGGATSPGLANAQTTTLFRVLNFELFAKADPRVMGLGIFAMLGIGGSLGYQLYQDRQANNKVKEALAQASEETVVEIPKHLRRNGWN
eukprot:m.23410 g.23410  ORF g.23410 m.23410 type:complete len:97 (+) comp7496_c0_seq1:258-548(+)